MDITKKTLEEIDSSREIENMKKVEAALFIAGRFLSLQELLTLTDVNPILLKKLLYDLQDKYKNSAIEIISRDNLWKMDVSPDYTNMVNKLATGSSEFTKARIVFSCSNTRCGVTCYVNVMSRDSIIAAISNRGIIIKIKIFNAAFILSRLNFLSFLSKLKKKRINGVIKSRPINIKVNARMYLSDSASSGRVRVKEADADWKIYKLNKAKNIEIIPRESLSIFFLFFDMKFERMSKPNFAPRPREINTAGSSKMP